MGANKDVTVAVWVGHPNSLKPMLTEYGGAPVDGGTIPALIFNDVITAYEDLKAQENPGHHPRNSGTTTAPSPTTPSPAPTAPTAPAPSQPAPAPSHQQPSQPSSPPPSSGGGGGGGGSGGGAPAPTSGGVAG